MNVLTFEQVEACFGDGGPDTGGAQWLHDFAHAIEAAVIRKLAAGVSVELTKLCTDNRGTTHYGYTEDQFNTAIAMAVIAGARK